MSDRNTTEATEEPSMDPEMLDKIAALAGCIEYFGERKEVLVLGQGCVDCHSKLAFECCTVQHCCTYPVEVADERGHILRCTGCQARFRFRVERSRDGETYIETLRSERIPAAKPAEEASG